MATKMRYFVTVDLQDLTNAGFLIPYPDEEDTSISDKEYWRLEKEYKAQFVLDNLMSIWSKLKLPVNDVPHNAELYVSEDDPIINYWFR